MYVHIDFTFILFSVLRLQWLVKFHATIIEKHKAGNPDKTGDIGLEGSPLKMLLAILSQCHVNLYT